MSKVRINSFEELSIELVQQLDGSSSIAIKEERRLDIETTDSVISNIMPCGFPSPEDILMATEERLGRQWDINLGISESRKEFISRMLDKAYN